ncbi:MAG: tRNA 5-hydroxyuridine modification protein YegQ [Aequoribacter sp.]|uniref:prephenate-dependent tRNA uridine(34) hydroxylase TrhP n=1 Tax=Aequoribacter sp. TaxID=2847771 RepID=UPI003C361A2C
MNSPELLSPAGSLKAMRYAFEYGADAVYAGQPRYSLRVRNNEFNDIDKLASAVNEAHANGKQFFIASNVSPHNDKLKYYLRDMEPVVAMKPDAIIMADPGLIMMVRERWPDLPIHLSVQSNAVNWATVKFWQKLGLTRIILSRELSLEEVKEIREQCPDIELEVFIHGALCIAYSGRCLLSGYITHRDSNQGACTNTCRWKYQAHEAAEDANGDVVASHDPNADSREQIFLLQEEGRPGDLMPAFEDEHGTYIMNSKDLRAIQHVKSLVDIGINCLKIEGRTKSPYYVARTAQTYRRAINDAMAGRDFDMSLMNELEKLASRGYTEGFYRRHPPAEFQNYEKGVSRGDYQQFVGEVLEVDNAHQKLVISVNNRFEQGDKLELMTPTGNCDFTLQQITNKRGEQVSVAPGSGHVVRIPIPDGATIDHCDYAMLARYLPQASL